MTIVGSFQNAATFKNKSERKRTRVKGRDQQFPCASSAVKWNKRTSLHALKEFNSIKIYNQNVRNIKKSIYIYKVIYHYIQELKFFYNLIVGHSRKIVKVVSYLLSLFLFVKSSRKRLFRGIGWMINEPSMKCKFRLLLL